MSLAQLKSKIILDAEAEAKRIKAEAEQKAEKIIQEGEKEHDRLKGEVEKEANRLAQERYQNIVTLARVKVRNEILAVKQDLINDVFDRVFKKMTRMSREDFQKLAWNLLAKYPPQEQVKLMVGKKNRDFIDRVFVEKLNIKLKSPGRFVLTEPDRDFDYGFYLVTDWLEIDLTFDGILRSIREQMEMEVIKILFGKG